MAKWRKAGVARLFRSGTVVLLIIDYLGFHKRLIIRVGELEDLLLGHKEQIEILEVGKWEKVGIARLSELKEVVILGIDGLESYQWLVIGRKVLWGLVFGYMDQIKIYIS